MSDLSIRTLFLASLRAVPKNPHRVSAGEMMPVSRSLRPRRARRTPPSRERVAGKKLLGGLRSARLADVTGVHLPREWCRPRGCDNIAARRSTGGVLCRQLGQKYASRLAAEREAGKDPQYLTQVWWAARTAERRFRAASGRFRPKHQQKMRRFGANR